MPKTKQPFSCDISSVTIYVQSDETWGGQLKFGAFTAKRNSPLCDKQEEMLDHSLNTDKLQELAEQETGLTVVEYDLYYGLSFTIEISSVEEIAPAKEKLMAFCQKHLKPWKPKDLK
jgi:hypothetical protein